MTHSTENPPPIGSEWYEDDSRVFRCKITVVAFDPLLGKVTIARGHAMKYETRTKAKPERFGKKRGYLPWSQQQASTTENPK
jgi:hypothetical protein